MPQVVRCTTIPQGVPLSHNTNGQHQCSQVHPASATARSRVLWCLAVQASPQQVLCGA